MDAWILASCSSTTGNQISKIGLGRSVCCVLWVVAMCTNGPWPISDQIRNKILAAFLVYSHSRLLLIGVALSAAHKHEI
jgi:uncharacterized protein YhhL (DUF1145 family)